MAACATAAGGLAAIAALAAGCGSSAAPPPQPRTAPPPKRNAAAPAPGAIHFVGRPDVRFLHASPDPEANVWFVTVVRVDRPLPQDVYGVGGDISISGATHDIPGLAQASGVQRCYWQQNPVASERRLPRDGQLVTVRLKIRGRHPQTLTARTRARELPRRVGTERVLEDAERRLGCPPAPPEHECDDVAGGRYLSLYVRSAGGGATCATARRVMRAVGRWVDSRRCFEDLCVRRHRLNAGFRCTVALTGEAAWSITCKRGREVVRAITAE